MNGWVGPLVVIVAVLAGGCALRLLDRLEARSSARPRGRARGSGARYFHAPASLEEWVGMGQRAKWDAETERRVKEGLNR